MGWGQNTAFIPWGKELIRHRKILNQFLYKKSVEGYRSIQMDAAHFLLQDLLSHPGECKQAFLQ
jgi:cytochrome P450